MESIGILRPVLEHEVELMRQWRNASGVRRNMYTTHEISVLEHTQWWQATRARQDREYLMFEHGGQALGIVCFTLIDNKNANSSWAFYTKPGAPKGTGSRMEVLALDRAFDQHKLHKLYCEVLAFNTPVISLHQKFGFQIEGIFRQQYRDPEANGDGFTDIFRLGLLAGEWADKRSEIIEKISKSRSRLG